MKNAPKGPSQRQLRVGEQIKHIIAETLQRGLFYEDKSIDISKITITEVRPSPDLKNATAYVMSLGGENLDSALEALNEMAATFQKDVNRKSNLKFTPRIRFKVDTSFEEAGKIEALLNNIQYSDQD